MFTKYYHIKVLIISLFLNSPLFIFAQNYISVYIGNSEKNILRNELDELREIIKISTGTTPSVVSSVEKNCIIIETKSKSVKNIDFGEIQNDGFVIMSLPNNNIVISGNNSQGTKFGVYYFLEKYFGIKWLMAGDLWTEIPSNFKISFQNINEIVTPRFKTRKFSPINPNSNDIFGNWGAHNLLFNNVEYHHNLYKLFSETKEYSPHVKGKRIIPSSKNDQGWQPNFSHKGIVDYSVKKIDRFFKDNPNMNSYSLGINDSKNFDDSNFSSEKNFMGLNSVSNSYYSWVKETVNTLNKTHSNKTFGLLAYENVAAPPSFKLPPNVIPFITLERLKWADLEIKQKDINALKSWNNVVNEVGWYDYIYGVNYIVPRPYFKLMGEYLEYGYNNGVKHFVSEFYTNPLEGPKGWIVSKLLIDPSLDPNQLLEEWCVSAFGKQSSTDMVKFYKIWENFWVNDIPKSKWWTNSPTFPYLRFDNNSYISDIPVDYMEKSTKLLNQAYSNAVNVNQRKRLEELLKLWKFSKMNFVYFSKKNLSDLKYNNLTKGQIQAYIQELRKNPSNTILLDHCVRFNKY